MGVALHHLGKVVGRARERQIMLRGEGFRGLCTMQRLLVAKYLGQIEMKQSCEGKRFVQREFTVQVIVDIDVDSLRIADSEGFCP